MILGAWKAREEPTVIDRNNDNQIYVPALFARQTEDPKQARECVRSQPATIVESVIVEFVACYLVGLWL